MSRIKEILVMNQALLNDTKDALVYKQWPNILALSEAHEQERLSARALRKTLIGASWEKQALEAYDKACKETDKLTP